MSFRIGSALALGLMAFSALGSPLQAQRLTVEQVIQLALEKNRDLRAARQQLGVADRQVDEAWSTVFPTVELNASYTRNISPTVSFLPAQIVNPDAGPDEFVALKFGADNSWSSNIRFEQPLFQARAFIGVGAAGRFRSLQEEMVRGVSHDIVTRVRLASYALLLAREQERLLGNSVARIRAALTEAQAMNRAGILSEYDVLRLEVELANLEPNLKRAQNAVTQRQRELAVELGVTELESIDLVGTLSELDIEAPESNTEENRSLLLTGRAAADASDADLLINTSLDRRSDLRQLKLTESLRTAELRVEQVEYLPKVSLFGNYIINAQQNGGPDFFGTGNNDRAYSRLAGVSVTLPIFNGFRENARIGQKREVLRQAETNTEIARERAIVQLRSLVDELDETRQRALAQKRAVAQARRGFDIASLQFSEGIGSQLERTDAENALRQSEFNYAQAVYDFLAVRARLDGAAGTVPLADGGGPR